MNKEKVLGILRHTLTFVGGILVAKGLVDETVISEVVGALITVIGGVWSVLIKR
jgi:hypothetical protein